MTRCGASQAVRSLATVFCLFCVVGFTVQVYCIGHRYFQYLTATATTIVLPNKLNASSVSLCCRYADLIPLEDGRPAFLLSRGSPH